MQSTENAGIESDLSAFEALFQSHGPRMKSLALNILGNRADAEDAVQEAFLKVYRSRGDFRGEASPSTWLYRILVNTCYDMGRKRRRHPEGPELEETDVSRAPAIDHPLRLTLQKALGRLPSRQRDVFLLFEVEGFKHAEIGTILGIPEGTSKSVLFDAKRALQGFIRDERRATRAS